nr:hypothetical protein [Tanacetum cinerariifolium]
MYDDYFGGQPSVSMENVPTAQEPQVRQTSTTSTSSADNVPIPTNSSSHETNIPITSQDVDELNPNAMIDVSLNLIRTLERLATPKPRKPIFLLRWSPTGRLFDQEGKLAASSNSESQYDCSNGNLKLLINFVWKFVGIVRFENDHVAAILGFGDLQWGNILITRVYFVEGLGHNLFSVRQFCDSDLEVAFRRNACFVRNLEGVDLLKVDHSTNLYTINLHEMASASLICLMARASSTKSWLWHQRLSHHNFDTINDLARNDHVAGLPMLKYHKENLCPSYEAPEVIIKFLKRITVLLQSPVIIIRTNNGAEFKNQVLKEYFDTVGISHQMSSIRTPQQNGVVERRNRTVYNRRTKKIMETMNVSFDELFAMAFKQRSSKPGLNSELDILFEAMYDDYIGGHPSATTTIADTAPIPTNSSSHATNVPISSQDVDKLNPNAMVDGNTFFNPFANSSTSAAASSSQQTVDPSNMHTFYQPYPHEFQWTKDHPLEQVIGEPS